ncbi:ribulose-phosphate 3-epimerase [Compostibacter hankyongensis]|uniref:Ribulose-phosphate 3-epimerase n=1 Tax=Compostibacter hankyongensis TaxID=1007089 RepID=A0ABP8FQC8_9BACT
MQTKKIYVAPSLLSANFLQLDREIDMINNSEADWLHFDVMDGNFVPNISFGLPILAQVKQQIKKPLDVHLMITAPERYAEAFREAGADHLTVHYEACPHLHRNIQQIRQLGMKAGVAINPHTSVSLLADIIRDVDIVLVMSVNPGFGGQEFIEHSLTKVRQLRQLINDTSSGALIEIDGGVTLENASRLADAGCDVLVAGNTVFNSDNPAAVIRQLKLG